MNGDKKSPFQPQLERIFRLVLLVWFIFIAIGAIAAYVRPLLPWIAGGVVLAVTTWIVVAVVRWRRSKW